MNEARPSGRIYRTRCIRISLDSQKRLRSSDEGSSYARSYDSERVETAQQKEDRSLIRLKFLFMKFNCVYIINWIFDISCNFNDCL